MWCAILAWIIATLVTGNAFEESKRQHSRNQQPIQAPTTQHAQPSAADQRGTDQVPITVKILPGEGTKEQAEKEERDRRDKDEKSTIDRRIADDTQRLANETNNLANYTFSLASFTLFLLFTAVGQVGLFVWQLKLIRTSANAAKIAANAAMLSARASIALQLPIIRVEPHTLAPGGPRGDNYCSVQFLTFSNSGPTKAFPIETCYGWAFKEKELPNEPRFLATEIFPPDRIFETGRTIPFQFLNFEIALNPGEWSLIGGDKLNLWFYCTFAYDDFMQTRHDVGFCWRWQNLGGRMGWHRDDTKAYNRKTQKYAELSQPS